MLLPGMLSSRRVPDSVRVDFDVVMARAWEAIAATHEQQAVTFVRRLATRLSAEEALQRYFREVAVPFQMRESVRVRALLALTPDERHRSMGDGAEPWVLLRPDHLVGAIRQRSRFVEETTLAIRMAAAAADEALVQTHVGMALEAARVLAPVMPLDDTLMQYIRSMDLAPAVAQCVFQRAMARLAETEMFETVEVAVPEVPALEPERRPLRILGLRAG